MDSQRFDAIAKLLFTGVSRRGAAATFAALAAIGTLERDDAAAKKKKKKKKAPKPPQICTKKQPGVLCNAGSECCSGRCEETDEPCPEVKVVCCSPLRGACQEQCDCCRTDVYFQHPDCHETQHICCIGLGGLGCAAPEDCCQYEAPWDNITCDKIQNQGLGRCCKPSGRSCENDFECCIGKVCQGSPGSKVCS